MPYILYLVPTEGARDLYTNAAAAYNARPYEDRDAGFDLYCAATDLSNIDTGRISQQVVAAFYDTDRGLFRAYWMLPRSSISRTPLRLANSVGLIDAGYRGDIMAAVDGGGDGVTVGPGARLFQLASPDLLPWNEVRIVGVIPGGATLRGTGGFGSTGVTGAPSTIYVASGAGAAVSTVRGIDISGVPIGRIGFNPDT